MTTTIARMQHANRGSHFQAYRFHGASPAQLDPFIGIDHAWMSAPTFPPHPHAGFSAVTYLFLDSETGIQNRDSNGNRTLIEPGGLHWTAAGRGVVHEENPAITGRAARFPGCSVNARSFSRTGDSGAPTSQRAPTGARERIITRPASAGPTIPALWTRR